ncbi:hypothetical protein HK104_005584 [Borealophlyctis nickersoniae]|nr:hypothetical protein HK104_005584 [Borealophlyctis nickersoniae]
MLRKARRRTTPKQLAFLEKSYANSSRPDTAAKTYLVAATGMSMQEINIWFQNRRAKEAKKAKSVPRSDFSMSSPVRSTSAQPPPMPLMSSPGPSRFVAEASSSPLAPSSDNDSHLFSSPPSLAPVIFAPTTVNRDLTDPRLLPPKKKTPMPPRSKPRSPGSRMSAKAKEQVTLAAAAALVAEAEREKAAREERGLPPPSTPSRSRKPRPTTPSPSRRRSALRAPPKSVPPDLAQWSGIPDGPRPPRPASKPSPPLLVPSLPHPANITTNLDELSMDEQSLIMAEEGGDVVSAPRAPRNVLRHAARRPANVTAMLMSQIASQTPKPVGKNRQTAAPVSTVKRGGNVAKSSSVGGNVAKSSSVGVTTCQSAQVSSGYVSVKVEDDTVGGRPAGLRKFDSFPVPDPVSLHRILVDAAHDMEDEDQQQEDRDEGGNFVGKPDVILVLSESEDEPEEVREGKEMQEEQEKGYEETSIAQPATVARHQRPTTSSTATLQSTTPTLPRPEVGGFLAAIQSGRVGEWSSSPGLPSDVLLNATAFPMGNPAISLPVGGMVGMTSMNQNDPALRCMMTPTRALSTGRPNNKRSRVKSPSSSSPKEYQNKRPRHSPWNSPTWRKQLSANSKQTEASGDKSDSPFRVGKTDRTLVSPSRPVQPQPSSLTLPSPPTHSLFSPTRANLLKSATTPERFIPEDWLLGSSSSSPIRSLMSSSPNKFGRALFEEYLSSSGVGGGDGRGQTVSPSGGSGGGVDDGDDDKEADPLPAFSSPSGFMSSETGFGMDEMDASKVSPGRAEALFSSLINVEGEIGGMVGAVGGMSPPAFKMPTVRAGRRGTSVGQT